MLKPLYCCSDYLVSDEGYVLSKDGTQKLRPSVNPGGYEIIVVSINTKPKVLSVHGAVMNTFKPHEKTSEKWQVNHIDGNKRNNHISNLEWFSPLENTRHKIEILKHQSYGDEHYSAKAVYAKNLKNNEELSFNSIISASKYIGNQRNRTDYRTIQKIIWRALNNIRKTAYGFQWFYAD